MEVMTWDVAELLEHNETLSEVDFAEMVSSVRSSERNHERFGAALAEAAVQRGGELEGDAVLALKVGQGYYALQDFEAAVAWLDKSGAGMQQCYVKAGCLRGLKDYDGAVEQFEAAASKGWDSFEVTMAITDCLRQKGDLEGAEQRLKKVARVGEIRAEYHFQLGRLYDAMGVHDEAMQEYEQAISLDGRHAEALFHLAYSCSLYGDEDDAVKYYEQCAASGRMHLTALLNLTVLYEDTEDYYEASQCVRKVLACYPNHPRARMYMKDIEGSKVMYYDEEQAQRIDRRNQVLEIPISDFELSVRSRNCLKKMNIRYLGDLLKVTESELLAYKNFGETSLLEIKAILAQKGLRLGQLLEDRAGGLAGGEPEPEETPDGADEYLTMSVDELELSVRSRKCLQRLNLNFVGELIKCTEAELLGCKNFGQTSLLEIKQRLKDRNLNLRELD